MRSSLLPEPSSTRDPWGDALVARTTKKQRDGSSRRTAGEFRRENRRISNTTEKDRHNVARHTQRRTDNHFADNFARSADQRRQLPYRCWLRAVPKFIDWSASPATTVDAARGGAGAARSVGTYDYIPPYAIVYNRRLAVARFRQRCHHR